MFTELPVKEGFFANREGIKLSYQECGEGPPIILVNGLGGRWAAWYFIVKHFHRRFRFLSWDYRGLYKSETPANPDDQTIPHHCEDLKDFLDFMDIKEAIFIGWSMGVQVNYEFYRYHPEMMRGIIAFDGTYGLPYDSAFNFPYSRVALDKFFSFVNKRHEFAANFMAFITKYPIFFDMAKISGLVAPSCSEELFVEMAAGFGDMNMFNYTKVMEKLADHDAYDVLRTIEVPVLVLVGSKDLMTPLSVAKQMKQQIPDCELKIIEGGTHYTPVEFPEETNRILEDFFEKHNF